MGKMIAAHMNSVGASNGGNISMGGASFGSVRIDKSGVGVTVSTQAQSKDGKTVYGPMPPPHTVSMEFSNWKKDGKVSSAAGSGSGGNNNGGAFPPQSSATFSFTSGKKQYSNNDVKTMMSLFSELMGMASNHNMSGQNPNQGNASNNNANTVPTNAPTNEELAREFYEKFIASESTAKQQAMLNSTDPLALRKAAFAAGVNVAMQQQMMREEISEREGGKKAANAASGNSSGGNNTNNNNNNSAGGKQYQQQHASLQHDL